MIIKIWIQNSIKMSKRREKVRIERELVRKTPLVWFSIRCLKAGARFIPSPSPSLLKLNLKCDRAREIERKKEREREREIDRVTLISCWSSNCGVASNFFNPSTSVVLKLILFSLLQCCSGFLIVSVLYHRCSDLW